MGQRRARHQTSAAGVSYTYDGDGRRVKKSNGTLYWYGMGGNVLSETALDGSNPTDYVYFGGQRLARVTSGTGATAYYYLGDHLGSARVNVQAGQNSACYEADFEPYGREHVITNNCPQHYKFTGKERDSESGLDYFGARYYGSAFGRFLSPDEFSGGPVDVFDIGGSPPPSPLPYAVITNPQSLNKYQYAYNNPLRFIDPDGHDVKDYLLLTSGANQVPNTPHPEVPNASTLGPQETATGAFFLLNTQATFDEGDNPGDYKALRDAYILGNKEGEVLQTRTGSEENPSKNQIANTGNSQFVYDSPGVSVLRAPKATLNGKLDLAFSLSEKNTKTGHVSSRQFFYRVTLVFDKGKLVGYQAKPISQKEFQKLTGQEKKKKKGEK